MAGTRTPRHIERVPVLTGAALTVGGITTFSPQFPLGEGWTRLILRVNTILTVGTGTTPIADGEISIIKAVTLRTDRGEVICNGIPGRALFYIDQIKGKTAPARTAIAAASATYPAQFSLWLTDPLTLKPNDTALDTLRYKAIKLDIQYGTVADLLGTVGTSSITATIDIFIERMHGAMDPQVNARISGYSEYTLPAPVNPASFTFCDIERSTDLLLKRIYMNSCNSATLGTAFSGTLANTTLADISFDTNEYKYVDTLPWLMANALMKTDYKMETAIVGFVVIDFTSAGATDFAGSNMEAIWTAAYSRFRVLWTNGTLSTSQISFVVEGIRKYK
jgi:hypothetical protein